MSQNGMSVGQDYTLAYYDTDTNSIVELDDIQNVRITPMKHDIKSMPYNKPPKYGFIPDGYSLTFTILRTGPEVENFSLGQVTRFNQGKPSRGGYFNETVAEADGSTSKYQYTDFVFWVTEIGEISREAIIKMAAVGMASEKIQIA